MRHRATFLLCRPSLSILLLQQLMFLQHRITFHVTEVIMVRLRLTLPPAILRSLIHGILLLHRQLLRLITLAQAPIRLPLRILWVVLALLRPPLLSQLLLQLLSATSVILRAEMQTVLLLPHIQEVPDNTAIHG